MRKIFSIFLIFSLILNINIITFADVQATTTTEKGWVQSSKGWIYYTGQGNYYYKNTLTSINGVQYYFDSNGIMAANKYTKYNSTLYYSDGNGSTKAFTGWKEEQTSARIPVYYLYYTGTLQKNKWSNYNGNFPSTSYSNSNCYYVGSDGKMVTNKNMAIGNESYSFDASGKATKTTSNISKDVVDSVAGNLNSVQTYFKNNILKGITSSTAIGDCIIDGKYYSGSGYFTSYKIGAKSALKKILEQKGFKIKSINDLSEKHWSNERVLNDMIYEYSFTVILEENKDSKNTSTNQNSPQTINNINQSNQLFTTLSGGAWGSNSSGHSTYTGANNGWYLITNSKNYPDWDNFYYWFNNGEWWVNDYQIYTRTPNVNDENNWLIWKNGKESKWKNDSSFNTNTQPNTANNNVINQPPNNSQGIITPNISSGENIANSNPININTQDVINLNNYKDISKYNLGNIQVSEYVDINSNGASIIKTDSENDIPTNDINSDYDSDTVDEILQDGSYTGDMWKSTTGTIKDQGSKYNNQYNWEAITELEGWQNWTVSNKTSELKGIWVKYNENTWYFITNATEQATYIQNEEKGTVKKVSQAYIIEDIASDITLCIDKKLYKFDESGICTTPDGVKGNKGIITLKADGTIDKGHEPELEENDISLPIYEKSDSAHTSSSYYYITYENTKNYSCLANGYFILKSSDTSFALYRADSNGKLLKQSSAGTSLYKINEYLKKNGSSYEAPDTIEVNDGKVTSSKTSSTNTSTTKTTNNISTNIIMSSKTTSNVDSGYVSNGKFYNSKDNMIYTVNSDGIIIGMDSGNKSGSTSGSYEVIDIGDNSFLKKS